MRITATNVNFRWEPSETMLVPLPGSMPLWYSGSLFRLLWPFGAAAICHSEGTAPASDRMRLGVFAQKGQKSAVGIAGRGLVGGPAAPFAFDGIDVIA